MVEYYWFSMVDKETAYKMSEIVKNRCFLWKFVMKPVQDWRKSFPRTSIDALIYQKSSSIFSYRLSS